VYLLFVKILQVCGSWESITVCLMVFNATFNNISVISWWSVLLVEETGGLGENHWNILSPWIVRKYCYVDNEKIPLCGSWESTVMWIMRRYYYVDLEKVPLCGSWESTVMWIMRWYRYVDHEKVLLCGSWESTVMWIMRKYHYVDLG
jgi:hypothetical protein